MGREYHVAVTGSNTGKGDKNHPYKTIQKAADVAMAGDTVIVHEGTYREWVKPMNSGLSDTTRIIYEAAPSEKVIIKGSEIIKNWEKVDGTVWRVTIKNSFFGDYNPFATEVSGDWYVKPKVENDGYHVHVGDVYLNGKSFYEAKSLDDVKNPEIRKYGLNVNWKTGYKEPILHPEDTVYVWYAVVDDENTTVYANFNDYDPNKELTEISVRRSCFQPVKTARNYITVRGFEMAQAATPWAPPTADQPGLLGANWSKGWVIENNIIHDSKCSGISIGKEESTGQNFFTRTRRKPGYQYQMEAVFKAIGIGWSKETVGSHVIRNNVIYDCGQTGIVGHLGCVFSEIYDNEIYNIAIKHEFFGHEIGGIKLHAAIDVGIIHNNIHHCSLGTWLDWEAQGTRVSQNLYYANERDIMIEVTHGPHLVDNNIFASERNLQNAAQGGAYVHNLFCGSARRYKTMNRSTPYHVPHSTDVAGSIFTYSADDRYYQNIFLGGEAPVDDVYSYGTSEYNDCPCGYEEFLKALSEAGNGDEILYERTSQPVYINRNCYLNGAEAYVKEEEKEISAKNPEIKITQEKDGTYLEMDIDTAVKLRNTSYITTEKLGTTRCSEGQFEEPDGKPITFNIDMLGNKREKNPCVGPLDCLKNGKNKIKIWERK